MKVELEPLSLIHQDLLEKKMRDLNLTISLYSFANLYLFRHIHRYEVLKIENHLFVKGLTRDRARFMMFLSHPSQYPIEIIKRALFEVDILFPIPEEWLPFFESYKHTLSYKEEESDYLYSVKKLASYPGRHLSKKRNLVKKLHSMHEVLAEDFNGQKEAALFILEKWREDNHHHGIETDYEACKEAIENCDRLHLQGRLIKIDGEPAGFTMGEKLAKQSYVIHFCKGLRQIKGLYQFLYQDLAQSIEVSCSWVNLEEDLGLSSLKLAKHSYQPDRYIIKWRVTLP